MVPRGAFTVPLLLVCAVSAITVPPPENVTLSCDNLNTTVSWDYRDREPGTSFIVTIISSDAKEQEQKTSDLHFDLTSFMWASPQRYTAFHSVNVTAVRQHRKSKPVKSNSLSFSKDKKAHVHCLLDFPPVNLTVDESGQTIMFENPFSFYSELRQAVKLTDVSFEFSVSSNNSSNSGQLNWTPCPVSQPICTYDLPDDLQDECVLLDGRLDEKKTFPVDFRQTERVCPPVPPPENVTLSCNNLKTTVSWEYSDRKPGTTFIVTIISSDAEVQQQETSDLHFDLTSFVWASLQRYTAYHSVNVTAVRQQRKSKPVKSNSLSFNRDKKVNVHCLLDFPPVNLTVDESGRTVRFENPLSFYRELKQAVKLRDVSFEFSVSSNSGQLIGTDTCPVSQPICRYDLPDDFQDNLQDECVLLDGHLDWRKTSPVDFRRTESVCPTYPPKDHRVAVAVTLSVLLCVVFLAIGAVAKCILNQQTLVKETPTPDLLKVGRVKQRSCTHKAQPPETSPVTLVLMEKRASSSGASVSSRASDSSRDIHPGDEDSVETQSLYMDDKEEEEEEVAWDRAHYDCGHATDIGGGDLVQGYN